MPEIHKLSAPNCKISPYTAQNRVDDWVCAPCYNTVANAILEERVIPSHNANAQNCHERLSQTYDTEANCLVCAAAPASTVIPPSILLEAEKIINGDRRDDYGGALESFERIAQLWGPVLGFEVTAERVCLALIQLKVARAMHDVDLGRPIKRDSIVDIAGYAGCLEKIVAERQR